ncbi:hypothetical protein B5X24_HaOG203236 [Helicoverpa armigera]|uniref:Uncharacterized protein n=1 Tax=Helicoverpa armigera TaxID=29058 RepID=A0A2W1C0D0_HELAM|nr:hypothetical protein B5X24_HaOG203236 [Helicoverpa armigera]
MPKVRVRTTEKTSWSFDSLDKAVQLIDGGSSIRNAAKMEAIAPAKLAMLIELKSMFQDIPEDCHEFYKNLKSTEGITDDVDGLGGEPDFKMQTDKQLANLANSV